MKIRALLLCSPFMNLTQWCGVATRLFEMLKVGKSCGVEYVLVFDKTSFYTAIKRYPFISDVLKPYKVYLADLGGEILKSAFALSRIAKDERVDLLISTSESYWMSLEAYVAAKISGKPWTAIWQPTEELLEPTPGISPLNPINILHHINSKPLTRKKSLIGKVKQAVNLLTALKLAEKTLTLTVSQSVIGQIMPLNPRANFRAIRPGNGVDLKKHQNGLSYPPKYQAIFFARLVPEKGLYDLPIIWKSVVRRFPKAKLAIAGITIDSEHIRVFHKLVRDSNLSENIIFLGELGEVELIKAIKSSSLTLYPSLLDSFSLVVLESLACGTPVVAYDIPAIRENYRKCSAVFRCPIKDPASMVAKIQYILKNQKVRVKLKKEAEEYARLYTWEDVVRSEKEAYIEVINWWREHF